MGGSLLEVMFNDDAPIDKGAREQIKALIAQQRDLTAEILAHQKHCEELQEEQETIQGERRGWWEYILKGNCLEVKIMFPFRKSLSYKQGREEVGGIQFERNFAWK